MDLKQHSRDAATGVGQIMLQESAITGTLFLLGIAVCSPLLAVVAALGSTVGCLTAGHAGFERPLIQRGMYGFNAALSALVPFVIFAFGLSTVLLAIAGAAGSAFIMRAMQSRGVSPYTAPFVLTGWAIYLLGDWLGLTTAPAEAPPLHSLPLGVVTGIGQVLFQDSVLSGSVFVFAIAVCSRRAALFACGGSVLGAGVALLLNQPSEAVASGIFGYNAALCGVAMSDRSMPSAAICAGISVAFLIGFRFFGLPAFTAPFVLATWIVRYR